MTVRRAAAIAPIVAMLCASIPAPVLAMSTQQEVQTGTQYDKQITEQEVVVTDPLLNAWVNQVGNRLWAQTVRKDVTYSIKILDDPEVNAFSTLGGYIYVNAGTLDFVQSDDELAGVIGHETGHIERRHAVMMNNKVGIMNILFGVGSLLSPLIYEFGSLAEAGLAAKLSRQDENQADKYGIMLMARAGYDPEAMRSFMEHLGAVDKDSHDLVSKMLADHPDTEKRVANLNGDPELDPAVRTVDQRLAAAVHNLDTARYSIAAMQLAALQKDRPDDPTIEFDLGQAQLAMGQVTKGEQNITAAADRLPPQAKTLADVRIKALRESEAHFDLLHPDLQPLREKLAAAKGDEAQAATAIESRRRQGLDQLKSLKARIQDITYGVPNVAQNAPKGGKADTVGHNMALMQKSLNTAYVHASETLTGVGTLQPGKEGGLLKESRDIEEQMSGPLALAEVPPEALSTLPDYPTMLAAMTAADGDMLRATDAARASLALLDVGLNDLSRFIDALRGARFSGRDLSAASYAQIEPSMTIAVDALNRAAVGAAQASQLYDMARSRQLQTRIDLLGVGESPDRFATFGRALDLRFHPGPIDYAALRSQGWSPGEIAAAVIAGADTNAAAPALLAQARASGTSLVDLANGRGMSALSLEIFLGLIYLDYTDDPAREAHGQVAFAGT